MLSLPPASAHGWTSDFKIQWVERAYPEALSDLLLQIDDDVDSSLCNEDGGLCNDDDMSVEEFADAASLDLV